MSVETRKTREVRVTAAGPVELRDASSDTSIGTLAGYAAVFGKPSQDLGGFIEQVDARAFNKTLADGAPVMARMNHDDAALLGSSWANTLRLSTDDIGLRYEVDLPDTQAGRDAKALAARGDLKWSSFAFRTIQDSWEQRDGVQQRTLQEVQLVDVAPVNSPAYLDTSVAMRALESRSEDEPPAAPVVPAPEPDPEPDPLPDFDAMRRRMALEMDAPLKTDD